MRQKTLKKINIFAVVFLALTLFVSLFGCALGKNSETGGVAGNSGNGQNNLPITFGTMQYRGFTLDNVYHSQDYGDIHYHSYFPDGYNTNEKYALFISLPGYEGLYFQGVGANICSENFVFEAQKYNDKMVIITPRLADCPTKN